VGSRTLRLAVTASAPQPASRRFLLVLLAIAAGALVVRVVYTVVVDPKVGALSDATAYHFLGEHLADGRGFIRPFDFQLLGVERATAEYPPLFPTFLGALSFVGIGSVNAQQLALTLVGTTTVVLTGLVGRRVAGDTAGLVAAAIAAVHPMLFQADGILMTESLATALVTGCVLLAVRARQHPSTGAFVALGALLGVATLSRSEGLLLAPLLAVPVAFGDRAATWSRRLAHAGIALGIAVVLVAPWAAYNYDRFDTVIPVSNNLGTVLDGANCDLTYDGAFVGTWRSQFGDNQASGFECFEGFPIEEPDFDEATAAAEAREDGLDYIRAHERDLPRVAWFRLARTWGVYRVDQQANLAAFEGRSRPWEKAGTYLHWALVPLAVAGVVLLFRRRAVLWPLLAPIVTVSVVAVLTYGNQRFRITADPMLAVLAGVSIAALVARMTTNAAVKTSSRPGRSAAVS
jgi:4-amino-4-deoxy-L-arabinose transferase-like glycosyltransferase